MSSQSIGNGNGIYHFSLSESEKHATWGDENEYLQEYLHSNDILSLRGSSKVCLVDFGCELSAFIN